jgi:glycerol-3-phosphate dehydrogenase
MWTQGTREAAWSRLAEGFDLIVVGGGITGAGIALEAARRQLKVLLVEQRDFAWGTSSRSSKLVHGGLRYLKEGDFRLTRESVLERQALLREAPGLVEPQSFVFADYPGRKPGRVMLNLGLMLYDRIAGEHSRRYYRGSDVLLFAPHIRRNGLRGGSRYLDAKTDDARLVLRVLQEAAAHGALLLNYASCVSLLRQGDRVVGAFIQDRETGQSTEVRARVVINATGVWADRLRGEVGGKPMLRPLRGSHLIFPLWRLPVAQSVGFMHPQDGRPVFAYPWEGVALVGTTDLDHQGLEQEAAITKQEVAYLLAALDWQFPELKLGPHDVLSTYAGVRPIVSSGKADPSKEARDHVVMNEQGLLTVTGGKLTTFRLIALDALKHVQTLLPGWHTDLKPTPVFRRPMPDERLACLAEPARTRLGGRYGELAGELAGAADPSELEPIAHTDTLWAELSWAARHEGVRHLDDLLLRRTRLGLIVKAGAQEYLPRIRRLVQPLLGWTDPQWEREEAAYQALIASHYSLPRGRDDQ